MMDISDMTVEEFETQDDGDASAALETQYRHYSLVLRTRKHATQTFLLVDSRADKVTSPARPGTGYLFIQSS